MTQQRVIRLGIQVDEIVDPVAATEAAVAAERAGLDLVVVPQRPEGAADAWTLLSWIAARTERIGLAAVGVDGSRPPAVTARAAAGLDLLSGGRLTLGLAGDELDDLVAIVRGMWDGSASEVHHAGRHRLDGAAPGPVPAHDIALWGGGDAEGTMEGIARLADGWVGDLGAEGVAPLLDQLGRLDRLAGEAGRDPRELTRAVTIPGEALEPSGERIEQLAALVHDHGVTTFVLRVGAPSAELVERFAREVRPVLEEAARRALADGTLTSRPVRRTEVRQLRHPGIDYDGVPGSLADTAVEPGDPGYGSVRSTYLRGGRPGLVLRPHTVDEVVDAVAFAGRHRHLPLGVRSGGHGISGRSTNVGGLVIDLGALNEIRVLDEAQRLVRLGPGARWKQVATVLQPHGWALGSGDYGGVGVGGLATAGGVGFLGRKHGLTIDHLRAVELVLADGSVVRATQDAHPELFWAVRGAGANVGIATAFEFTVDEVPDVGWAQLGFQVADPAAFLVDFGRVTDAAPRETTPFLLMGGSGTAQIMAMVASDDPEVIVAQLQPFAEIAPLIQQQVVIAPYAAVMNMVPDSPHHGVGEPVARSGLVTELTPEVAAASARLLTSGATHFFQIRSMGGAVADVEPEATAFAHRDARYSITAMGSNAQRLDRSWDDLRPLLSGVYLSFETDTRPDRVTEAFPPQTLDRLRAVKSRVDPTNLFRDNFNVAPHSTTGSPA